MRVCWYGHWTNEQTQLGVVGRVEQFEVAAKSPNVGEPGAFICRCDGATGGVTIGIVPPSGLSISGALRALNRADGPWCWSPDLADAHPEQHGVPRFLNWSLMVDWI